MAIDNEDVPYRSPVPIGVEKPDTIVNDDQDYSTLLEVGKELDEAVQGLYKDFNAFDILKLLESPTLDEAARKLLAQVMGKQAAYDILEPLQAKVNSAIADVKERLKHGRK